MSVKVHVSVSWLKWSFLILRKQLYTNFQPQTLTWTLYSHEVCFVVSLYQLGKPELIRLQKCNMIVLWSNNWESPGMTSCFSDTRFYKIFIEAAIVQMFSGGMKLVMFMKQKTAWRTINKEEWREGVQSGALGWDHWMLFIYHNVSFHLILIRRGSNCRA